jgi:hypothetical protein
MFDKNNNNMEDIKVNLTPQMKAAVSHFQAQKDKAVADLEIYLNRPVGVGSHAVITNDTIKLLEELEHANSMLELLGSIIVKEEESAK